MTDSVQLLVNFQVQEIASLQKKQDILLIEFILFHDLMPCEDSKATG